MTVSQWSDANRKLSRESSAEPGDWRTDRAAYQRGIMDAINDAWIHTIVLMKCAQSGFTEMINNIIGYFIDYDPCSMLLVQPTLEMGQAWSKDRLAPMLRDTPILKDAVSDPKSRDSGNTMLHKLFPGGHLTIVGANSPAGLASRPIRIVLCDEVDRYPASAGSEGDPVYLAAKRSTTFWNRKLIMGSTPTIKGISRIEAAFEDSNQSYYFVPCPHCDFSQRLMWANIHWPEGMPQQAYYGCVSCGAVITDADKAGMLSRGEWRATKESNGVAGFHVSELYSPWVSFGEMASNFVRAKKLPETLKTWINTALGETWDDAGQTADENELLARCENYPEQVPQDVRLLTAGVDVQDDRLEIEVVGWGEGNESWSVDYKVFHGDPAKDLLWSQLDDYLLTKFNHESGNQIGIAGAGLDTGGHHTQAVYRFCKARYARRIFALKGVGGTGKPVIGKPSRSNSGKVHLFPVGVDTAKEMVYSRLRIKEPGPGYCHFPAYYQAEYFNQLTGEKLITKYNKGRAVRAWTPKKSGQRVEALDCRVYALAVLELFSPNYKALQKKFLPTPKAVEVEKSPLIQQPRKPPPRRGGFVNRWKA